MQNYKNTLLSLLAFIMAIIGVVLAWNDSQKSKQKVEELKIQLADKQLIKELRLRLGQIEAQQLSGTAIHDTVRLEAKANSRYEYADRWARFTLSMKPPDTTIVYTVSDSVATIVYREYKHKFLWWRWGTKGYKVKVVNFNPHATIRYNQYIKVE